jgi:hypothetical protein
MKFVQGHHTTLAIVPAGYVGLRPPLLLESAIFGLRPEMDAPNISRPILIDRRLCLPATQVMSAPNR